MSAVKRYVCDRCREELHPNDMVTIRLRFTRQSWPDGVRHLHYCVRCWNEMTRLRENR
jgi:RNase P subunit RPR2